MASQNPPPRIAADRYRSTTFHERECDQLWPRSWQLACTLDCLPNPGDYYEYRVAGLSVLIVRDEVGDLHGFQNVCIHRGNALLEGSGSGLCEIRCPYHHWRYDLAGRLIAVSKGNPDGRAHRGPGGLTLIPVQVDSWGGFVFMNLDPDAVPLDEFLHPMAEELAWVRMDEYTCTSAMSLPVACNWKVVIDAFIETYHLHAVHPQMLAIADDVHTPIRLLGEHSMFYQPYGAPSPRVKAEVDNQEIWEAFTNNLGHRLGLPFAQHAEPGPHPPIPAGGSLRPVLIERIRAHLEQLGDPYPGIPDDQIIDDYHYHFFPNTVFNVFAGWFGFIRARPGDRPDHCVLDMWNFDWLPEGHPDRHAQPVERWLEAEDIPALGPVMAQDLDNLPRTQAGLEQPGLQSVQLVPEEARIGHMHRVLDRYLGTSVEAELGNDPEPGR